MPRRGENIRKRKDGRWEGRYIKAYDSGGKAKYVSVYGKSYLEVKKKLTEAVGTKENTLTEKGGKRTFRELLYLWLENSRLKLKEPTYAKYHRLIESHILPVIGHTELKNVDTAFLNRILSEKSSLGRLDGTGGLSPASVRCIAFILKSAYEYGVQNEYCLPLKGELALPAKPKKTLEILSKTEQTVIENACMEALSDKELGVLLSLYTGIRIGEVCGLKWEDIDHENNTLHIRHTVERIPNISPDMNEGKTKLAVLETKSLSSNRMIPIPTKLLPFLSEQKSGYVVKGLAYDYTDPRTMQYFFRNKLKRCGIRQVNYHALRHTFATRCMEAGMDTKSLSEILGHASVSITLGTYVHSTLEHKRKQMEAMAAICGQK